MSFFGTIYADTAISSKARMVFMYLKDRSSSAGTCWPSVKRIASDLNISVTTVKRALGELERAGYVQKTARHRPNGSCTSNLYSVTTTPMGQS